MPVAPAEWPSACGENTMPSRRLERPSGRRRQRAAGVIEFVLELGLARDAADRRVAGVALDGLGRHRTAALELARRRALDPGQRVEAGPEDQLRSRAGAVAPAA